jgi:O-antigen ligase
MVALDTYAAQGDLREAAIEERILMVLTAGCLLLLPIRVFSALRMPLYAVIALLEILFFLVSSKRLRGLRVDTNLLAVSGIFFFYMFARWIASGGAGSERIIQSLLFLLTLVSFSRYRWDESSVHRLFVMLGVLMAACLAFWFVSGRVTNYYAAFYGHGNGFAVVIVATIVMTLLDARGGMRLRHWSVLALCGVLLLFANSRSAILTVMVLLILVLIFRKVSRNNGRFRMAANIAFLVVLACALAFSVLYPSLYGTNLGNQLELLSREYLNKNFFSGREVVWKMVLQAIDGNELFGLGLQMTPSMIYNTSFSSHNLYLQTMLQSGTVGLSLLVVLLWTVLNRLGRFGSWESCVGAALLIAMLVHDCLEVSLTQNNFDYGLLIWAIWGICLALGKRCVRLKIDKGDA